MKLFSKVGHRYRDASFDDLANAFLGVLGDHCSKDLQDAARTVIFHAVTELAMKGIVTEKPLPEALAAREVPE